MSSFMMQVLESPAIKLASGKFVDTYATMKVVKGVVSVELEYNGFIVTSTAALEAKNMDEALKIVVSYNLVESAARELTEAVNYILYAA